MTRALASVAAFILILAFGSGISYWVYDRQYAALISDGSAQLAVARSTFSRELNRLFDPGPAVYETITDTRLVGLSDLEVEDLFFAVATGPVRRLPQINGIYIGFPDGRFLQVQDLVPLNQSATEGKLTRRVIDDPTGEPAGHWFSTAKKTGRWVGVDVASGPYDPRSRPWYKEALAAESGVWTKPYQFASSGSLGVTYTRKLYHDDGALWGVLGVDLSLSSLSLTLVQASEILNGFGDLIFATDLAGRMLGHPDLVRAKPSEKLDVEAFLERYREKNSVEQILIESLLVPGTVSIVDTGEAQYLATRAVLDPDLAMPISIYLAEGMNTILADANTTLMRNVTLLFVAIVAFGTVSFYVVKLGVEVTARKKAEAELVEARDMAEAATRAKSSFLATMSHEIRTPMNGVMSMAELLALSKLNAEQSGMARVIRDSAGALLTIINDILDFSKIEAGKLDIETVPFSLMETVDGASEILIQKADEKGLSLIVDIQTDLADQRHGDPTRLRQILLNLGGNAVKFTERGNVRIKIRELSDHDGEWLRFEVLDTGIGLTEEQCSKLFKPFVQADQSTARKFGGTGLGLSISHRLTELMGGRIGALSTLGEGSTFWFELPVKGDEGTVPAPDHDLSAARVLLAGLEPCQADVATRYLQAGGVTDIGADDPENTQPCDLVIAGLGGELDDARRVCKPGGALALCAGREALAGLPDAAKKSAAVLLPLPITRPKLWRAVAIALGLERADAQEGDARPELAFTPPPLEEARSANAIVLVAEDNPTNQVVVRKMLFRMGFACEIVDDGAAALAALDDGGHGLLLTDINMPGMDGFSLARAIRGKETAADKPLPIIALTADAMAETEAECLAAGMNACLTKPIDSKMLVSSLSDYLPAGLPLRRDAESDEPEPEEAEDVPDLPVWDREIFEPAAMEEAFGKFDDEAKEFVLSARGAWGVRISEVGHAMQEGDMAAARNAAHSLKGAALSVGALRLGRIAGELQDALDAQDDVMAGIMAEVLEPTLTEFDETVKRIF
ncbi:ATP-binding protein [Nisaea sp.]|uniref:ATP-binding protein n=1 Tax=Nisaea sp. TaxID=2024842 RepID=UPI003265FF70